MGSVDYNIDEQQRDRRGVDFRLARDRRFADVSLGDILCAHESCSFIARYGFPDYGLGAGPFGARAEIPFHSFDSQFTLRVRNGANAAGRGAEFTHSFALPCEPQSGDDDPDDVTFRYSRADESSGSGFLRHHGFAGESERGRHGQVRHGRNRGPWKRLQP